MCSIDDCPNPVSTKGMCDKHYKRFWRYGDPHFIKKVQRYTFDECWTQGSSEECWLWRGRFNGYGYGVFHKSGQDHMAHRLLYEQFKGKIPDGLVLDHLCRTTECVNPNHLEPVTHSTNTMRGLNSYVLRDTCRNGLHDITLPNAIYTNCHGQRSCYECVRENWRRADIKRGRPRKPAPE